MQLRGDGKREIIHSAISPLFFAQKGIVVDFIITFSRYDVKEDRVKDNPLFIAPNAVIYIVAARKRWVDYKSKRGDEGVAPYKVWFTLFQNIICTFPTGNISHLQSKYFTSHSDISHCAAIFHCVLAVPTHSHPSMGG
jgi:hypothetical protein